MAYFRFPRIFWVRGDAKRFENCVREVVEVAECKERDLPVSHDMHRVKVLPGKPSAPEMQTSNDGSASVE
jgi:hypothetical protein